MGSRQAAPQAGWSMEDSYPRRLEVWPARALTVVGEVPLYVHGRTPLRAPPPPSGGPPPPGPLGGRRAQGGGADGGPPVRDRGGVQPPVVPGDRGPAPRPLRPLDPAPARVRQARRRNAARPGAGPRHRLG